MCLAPCCVTSPPPLHAPPPFVRSRKVFLPLQPSEQACEKHSEDQAPQPAARLGASA